MFLVGTRFTKKSELVAGGNSQDAEIWACVMMIESMKKSGSTNAYADDYLPLHGAFLEGRIARECVVTEPCTAGRSLMVLWIGCAILCGDRVLEGH